MAGTTMIMIPQGDEDLSLVAARMTPTERRDFLRLAATLAAEQGYGAEVVAAALVWQEPAQRAEALHEGEELATGSAFRPPWVPNWDDARQAAADVVVRDMHRRFVESLEGGE